MLRGFLAGLVPLSSRDRYNLTGRAALDPWLRTDDLGINEGMVAVADTCSWMIQQINRSSGRQLRSQPISSADRRRFL